MGTVSVLIARAIYSVYEQRGQIEKVRRAVELAGCHMENGVFQQFLFHDCIQALPIADGKGNVG